MVTMFVRTHETSGWIYEKAMTCSSDQDDRLQTAAEEDPLESDWKKRIRDPSLLRTSFTSDFVKDLGSTL